MTYTGLFRQPIKTSVFPRKQFIEAWDDHDVENRLIGSKKYLPHRQYIVDVEYIPLLKYSPLRLALVAQIRHHSLRLILLSRIDGDAPRAQCD